MHNYFINFTKIGKMEIGHQLQGSEGSPPLCKGMNLDRFSSDGKCPLIIEILIK